MNYIKCPICELNYIRQDEKCCNVCKPNMGSKLISDIEIELENERQTRLEKYKEYIDSKNDYLNIRYNRKPI